MLQKLFSTFQIYHHSPSLTVHIKSEHIKSVILALSKQISIKKVYCWSDSLIALWWIKENQKPWKLWIQNRVNKIRENVNTERWNYLTSENNPADVATRRASLNSIVKILLR